MFGGYFDRCAWPTRTSRGGFGCEASPPAVARAAAPNNILAVFKPGIRNRFTLCDPRSTSPKDRAELRRRSFSNGASSSVNWRELACDVRRPLSSRLSRSPSLSSDLLWPPPEGCLHNRFPTPMRRFLSAIPGPALLCLPSPSRETRGDPREDVVPGSSSSRSRSSSEPESSRILDWSCGCR